jgi:predicted Zn-dependent protease
VIEHTWAGARTGPVVACMLFALSCTAKPAATPGSAPRRSEARFPEAPKALQLQIAPRSESVEFDPVVTLLAQELGHSVSALASVNPAPYFVGYHVVERHAVRLVASDGSLVSRDEDESRSLDVDIRIGSPEKDNTHRIPGETLDAYKSTTALPLDWGEAATRNALWLATDSEYDAALARWLRVQTLDPGATDDEPRPDFSAETPVVHAEPKEQHRFDEASWTERLVRLSAASEEFPMVQRSEVALSFVTETRYQVNSEGTRLQLSHNSVRLELQAQTLADDGMLLDRFDSVDARRLDDIPADSTLRERYRQLFLDIRALQKAPVIEPYVGPAILDGRAAGVFFHEVFGHRIEGHRQDAENEGQTFASMIGQPIMDTDLDVYDDPNIERLNGVDLNGFYAFDDEGVPAERANLVQAGILRGFLMSRTPARGFLKSNGHGRRAAGHSVVARQANLVVDPIHTVSRATLEQALLSEVREQGLPYGLRFAEISGGFTQTQRYDTQAFKVIPVMVYRLYPDGRQELVRGVDIEGTPLTALSKIELAANDFEVFNGVCGAESGWVPVSATSPSLLLSQIEVARQEQSNDKPPLLPPPSPAKGDRP